MADEFDKALALARQPRGVPALNPLARRNNAVMHFEAMQEREAMLRATHDAYEGLFGNYPDPQPVIAAKPKEYLEQPGRISINLTRLFIDTLSVSYNEAPQRVYYRNGERVKEDDPVLIALSKQMASADYDRFMGMVDRWMRLLGNVVVRPIWDEVNKQLVYHAYPSYCVRVLENPKNPRAPEVTILLGYEQGSKPDGLPDITPTAEIWDRESYRKLVGEQVKESLAFSDAAVRYDFSPLVHCFDQPPFGGKGCYFVNAPGWQIAQQNQRLNEDYFSQYIYAALMQAIGILMVKGPFEGALEISPGRALHFPNADDASGLQSVAQGAMLSDFQGAIQFIIDQVRESYGIPKSILTADVMPSGAAIIQASAPLMELRKHRQPLFAKIETDLLRATLQELRGRAEGFETTLNPADWDVAILYPEPMAGMSVADQVAFDEHLLSIGVLTPGDIAMREKPGQFDSKEEADKFIAENKPEPVAPATAAVEPADEDASIDTSTKEP